MVDINLWQGEAKIEDLCWILMKSHQNDEYLARSSEDLSKFNGDLVGFSIYSLDLVITLINLYPLSIGSSSLDLK